MRAGTDRSDGLVWVREWRPVLALLGAAAILPVPLGVLAGLMWSALAPRSQMLLTRAAAVYAELQPQAPIAADGWFAAVTAVTGALCAVVVFLMTRRRLRGQVYEIATLIGLAVGGLGGSLAAWAAGWAMGLAGYQERVRAYPSGTEVVGNLQVHATGVIVVWPLSAVVVFTALLAVRGWRHHA